MKLSTLRDYAEPLDGRLKIVAEVAAKKSISSSTERSRHGSNVRMAREEKKVNDLSVWLRGEGALVDIAT